jgi:peroxiredoxin
MSITNFESKTFGSIVLAGYLSFCAAGLSLYFPGEAGAQGQQIVWSKQEKPILEDIRHLRELSEGNRAKTTQQLALKIRQLPAGLNKERLAVTLASLSTEGDSGKDVLQEVATTLAEALREQPIPAGPRGPEMPYSELAKLAHYEHVQVNLDDPQYATAMSKIEADDLRQHQADFTLTDLHGKAWALKDLRGQVVLVNIWATWCPPCRSEMPDLDSIYRRFKKDGLIVLAITDEDAGKAEQFVNEHRLSYPILLDPDKNAHRQYTIEGLPRSFVYDRDGKLVAQAIDRRTKKQFLDMLELAGLR